MEKFESVLSEVNNYMDQYLKPFESIETICAHGGYDPLNTPDIGCPVIAPISLSTTFKQTTPNVAKYDYSRAGNYSRECLEKCIAQLEDGDHCSVFGSGLACLGGILQLLSVGDHIVAFDDMYGGSGRYLRTIGKNSGLDFILVDMRDEALFKAELRPDTRLVMLETPSNPLMKLIDIERISTIAHEYNKDILVAVDNTFMSSYFQRPLDFGADLSWHSLTKYMNGHSDVVMGAVITRNRPELAKKLSFLQLAGGAVPSPFDCYLCLRGIRTLGVRMQGHMRNALIVAKMLQLHPNVDRVIHPGLKTHEQRDLALKQMKGFSGMITIYLKATAEETVEFVENVKIFTLAESLGGFESLIEIPSLMTHASVPAELRKQSGILDTMLRLSVGLENPMDLVKSLYARLDKLHGTTLNGINSN